jgi:hypothetical protein
MVIQSPLRKARLHEKAEHSHADVDTLHEEATTLNADKLE